MADLDQITESLRRQRRDLETLLDNTTTRGDETTKVLEKLDELRRRAEQTATLTDSSSKPPSFE